MTEQQARSIIIGSMAATGVVVTLSTLTGNTRSQAGIIADALTGRDPSARRQGRLPGVRVLVGLLVAGAVLSMVTELSPDLGAAFAVLLMLSTIVRSSPALWQTLTRSVF